MFPGGSFATWGEVSVAILCLLCLISRSGILKASLEYLGHASSSASWFADIIPLSQLVFSFLLTASLQSRCFCVSKV